MPGSMPSPAVGHMFGGKKRLSPAPEGEIAGGKSGRFGKDQHGLHGAIGKKPRATKKEKAKRGK
jgi:hypothetical protein